MFEQSKYYKPFRYPWAFQAYETQNQMHWIPQEVPLHEDIVDWNKKLTEDEKNLLTHIFRFFTQGDVDVANGYLNHFIPVFKNNEIRMMLSSFANMEAVHQHAYSLLIDTIGMPETTYSQFLEYQEMADKHNYLESIKGDDVKSIAKKLAIFSGFVEGIQLFSSFIILLNFSRFGKMKGMGQIVTWSIRDESHHVENMSKLFTSVIDSNPAIWTDHFKAELYQACRDMVRLEFNFIDLAFASTSIEGLTSSEVKEYVKYIADRRLLGLGLKPNYGVKENPLPWVEEILNAPEHMNFFENRSTEYAKGALTGQWSDVWDQYSTQLQ